MFTNINFEAIHNKDYSVVKTLKAVASRMNDRFFLFDVARFYVN